MTFEPKNSLSGISYVCGRDIDAELRRESRCRDPGAACAAQPDFQCIRLKSTTSCTLMTHLDLVLVLVLDLDKDKRHCICSESVVGRR